MPDVALATTLTDAPPTLAEAAIPVTGAGGRRLSVEPFTDEAAFHDLEPDWNRVLEESGARSPFLRHEWLRTWWECFGGGRCLEVLRVRDGRRTIALAPMMSGRGRLLGVPVRRLELLANAHVPRLDVVVAGRTEEAYRALWGYWASRRDQWDVIQLADLPADSPTLDWLRRLAEADGFRAGDWPSMCSPYVPIAGPWDAYAAGLHAKHRSNLRNRMRRLERLGAVSMEVVTSGDALASALDEALRLEAVAWKGAAGTAILCRPETERFYRALARVAAERSWLRLYFLTVGGRRVAFEYTLVYDGRIHVLKLGHDPEYARYAPQHLLCFLILRDAFAGGLSEYDFLGACEGWKLDWARRTRPHSWLFIFAPGWRGRLLHGAKFRLIPALQRRRLYRAVRRALFGP